MRQPGGAQMIDALHLRLGIAQAGGGADRNRVRDLRQIVVGQIRPRARRYFRTSRSFRLVPGNRHDVVALRQQPGERELAQRAFLLARHFLDAVATSDICGRDFPAAKRGCRRRASVSARLSTPPVSRPAPERRIGDERDIELPRRLQCLLGVGAVQQARIRSARRRSDGRRGRGEWFSGWLRSTPSARTLPCFDQLAMAPTVSSIGTFGSIRC